MTVHTKCEGEKTRGEEAMYESERSTAWKTRTQLRSVEKEPLATETKRKILFVVNTVENGGLEKHLIELIRRIRNPAIRLSILCYGPDFYTERLNREKNVCISIRCEREPKSFWGWLQVLRQAQPDVVVFVHGWIWSFPWYVSAAAWMAGVRKRFAIQHLTAPTRRARDQGMSMRSVLRALLGGWTPCLVRFRISSSFFDRTICVSNAVRESLVNSYRFQAKKTITIHNGVSASEFIPCESNRAALRTRFGLGPKEFVLACVARLTAVKGIDILLLAMARVLRDGVGCKCIIVGDGPLRMQLSEQAQALGLGGHVFFVGFQEDVRPYLQGADAFVLTSHAEGLPLSIIEAMACGLPCVVTNAGGNAEAVRHTIHGIVVPPGSVEDVAVAISYLVGHPQECEQMSRSARDRAREMFGIEDNMAEIKRVILS
jgi:glycosyltransferase involved in cell wall biosynthesis